VAGCRRLPVDGGRVRGRAYRPRPLPHRRPDPVRPGRGQALRLRRDRLRRWCGLVVPRLLPCERRDPHDGCPLARPGKDRPAPLRRRRDDRDRARPRGIRLLERPLRLRAGRPRSVRHSAHVDVHGAAPAGHDVPAGTGQPRAGKPLTLTLTVIDNETGGPLSSGKITCLLLIHGTRLPARTQSLAGGVARCTLAVPRTSAGRRFRVTIRLTAKGATVGRSLTGRVR